MFGKKNPEVLISGAGPVGLFAALALARQGVRVKIVDRGIWPCTHSYALALHAASLKLLEGYGLRQRILETAVPVRAIGLYDRSGRRAQASLEQDAAPGYPVVVLRQDVLEDLLEKALHEVGVEVSWNHEVFSLRAGNGHVAATVNETENESRGYAVAHVERVVVRSMEMEVPFVIGADGCHSRVRQAAGIQFSETGPAQHYAVFEFRSNADLHNEMCLVLGESTIDVLWPLPEGACRWSFELPEFAAGAERVKDRQLMPGWGSFPELEESSLRALIAERAPWFQGSIENVNWRIVVRFEKRLAESFGKGRMWLAGDAAHLTGPAGIQSMNLGLLEAHELAGAVAAVLREGESLDSLDAYNRRWMPEWRRLHGLAGGLHAGPRTDPWVAVYASRLLSCLPAHGESLSVLAGQFGLWEDPAGN